MEQQAFYRVWSAEVRNGLIALLLVFSCGRSEPQSNNALQFWHTFNPEESAALQRWLADSTEHSVIATILPFARASARFRSALQEGNCPDLVRMDATRIPGLARSQIIAPVPTTVWQQRTWLPEAENLVLHEGQFYGLPQSLDGLALVRRRDSAGHWPFASIAELEELAGSMGILIDGYWFLAFLRAGGSSLPGADGLPSIANPEATAALTRFAALFARGLAMDLLEERVPSRAMATAFREGKIAVALAGPWDLRALSGGPIDSLEVAAFPGEVAPRGGQVLVVPRCSKNSTQSWQLALELTAPALQATWATKLGMIPVTHQGLERAGRVANEFYQALDGARMLPRHPHAPKFFDDLTPAVMAVVGGDATAEEALQGVDRAWQRLYNATPRPVP